MQSIPEYLFFWGKAEPSRRPNEHHFHPLAYHSLDVAAVADRLLELSPRKLEQMARLLGTTPTNARALIVMLIALHDVGKFSAHFQAKSKEAWPESLGEWQLPPAAFHDEIASRMRRRLSLKALMGNSVDDWPLSRIWALWHAVVGHHGQPRIVEDQDNIGGMISTCWNATHAFAQDISRLFSISHAIPCPHERAIAVLSWAIVGLTVASDWIGSNRNWFPYVEAQLGLQDYYEFARKQAREAVKKAGILPIGPTRDLSPHHLLPHIDFSKSRLSPLQAELATLALPQGPTLLVVEDVTGSGKTEAALLLAARFIADGRANGLFFALPTMATANAMFERLRASYRRLFAEDSAPSLVLAHGKRRLHEGFEGSILLEGEEVSQTNCDDKYEESASSQCAVWIADDRRKAFLAHVGIGTIDQALLGVLPSRHQSLRLWGMSDRVLVVDEAHAYDAYMGRELERLLEFHSALGGSAIVLSATLPQAQRSALVAAFQRGLGGSGASEERAEYPLVTIVSDSRISGTPVATRSDRVRKLPVRRVASCDQAIDEVVALAGAGAAVAWIRNAVDDAIEAAKLLRSRGVDVVLLHARFAMGDRIDIETRVRDALGPDSISAVRQRMVVVGTQILEQSLDYDVDAMVTDLAPIDLIIQRAGRLWRHRHRDRDRPMKKPELLVFSPDPGLSEVISKDWYRTLSPRAAAVYGHHGLVWRSAKVLFERGCITTPDGIRGLIDAVYGLGELDDIPEPLQRASRDAEGKRSAERATAGSNLLKLEKGYGGETGIWSHDVLAPTRLGEEQTVFRLGKLQAERVVPWFGLSSSRSRSWALSEVSVRKWLADGVPNAEGRLSSLIEAAKLEWPEWERKQPLLLLEPHGKLWRGMVTKLGQPDRPVVYDTCFGLRFTEA